MKKTLKTVFYQICQKLGVRIEKIQTPEQIFESAQRLSHKRAEGILTDYTYFLSYGKNHKNYEKLLKLFVPQWKSDFQKADFIDTGGGGDGSLNTYRTVYQDKEKLFEKIYFTESKEFQTVEFFQDNIYPVLKDDLKIPSIRKRYKGEFLTMVYFEFFEELTRFKVTEEGELTRFPEILYKKTKEHKKEISELVFPETLLDFESNRRYSNNKKYGWELLRSLGLNPQMLHDKVTNSDRVLSHGDLSANNGFKDLKLIDWDCFGYLPLGYDPALMFSKLRWNNNPAKPTSWLTENFKEIISDEDWSDFSRNFYYFLFILYAGQFQKGHYKELMEGLTNQLKSVI